MEALTPERWRQLEPILGRALKLPPSERPAFLGHACAADPTLRAEVETLLGADAAAGRFLEEGAYEYAAELLSEWRQEGRHVALPSGQRIGPYRIVRELGRGGMGVVYLAERADGQFDQQVALKLIRQGGDFDAVVRRFLAERQILARLRHENIARLFDGGLAEPASGQPEDRQPYFIMELVEGAPITDYCDERRLSVEQRLALFLQVGRAVQYAHRNLVVHRDLKPSNILVTDQGRVKLLDFGIAKLLAQEQDATEAVLTQTGRLVLTPQYAAPEQARSEAVTTATDVYALGLVLYELLAGRRPYRVAGLGPLEMARVICEVEPDPPSVVVGRVEERRHADGTATTIAPEALGRQRGVTAERLRRQLQGDLDTIVLKALKKEPERRYQSADQFVEDVQRYLAGLPVVAQPDTLGYRLRKFVGRHRVGVAAALALLVLLAVVLGLLGQRAAQAERIQQEAAKLETVQEFLVGLFEVSDPENVERRDITARELLDRGVERIAQLADQPEVQAALSQVLGVVYRQLGMYPEARTLLEQALAQRRALHGSEHVDVARSLSELAWLLDDMGTYDEAERLYREALAMQRKLLGNEHEDVAESLNNLALLLYHKGALDEAEAFLREALDLGRSLLGDEHPHLATGMNNLAMLLHDQGSYDEAERLYRQALAMRRNLLGVQHPHIANNLANLATLLQARGNYEEAESLLREALAMERNLLGDEHPSIASDLNNLAMLLRDRGNYDEAESLLREALAMERNLLGDEHPHLATGLNNLAMLLHDQGSYDEAERLYRQALAMLRNLLGDEHPHVATGLNNLATLLHDQGSYDEAERLYRQALAMRRKLLGAQHPSVAQSLHRLGQLALDRRRLDEAEPLLRQALALRLEAFGAADDRTAQTQTTLGICLTALGAYEEAESLLRESYTFFQTRQQAKPLEQARQALVALYTAWGKPEQASGVAPPVEALR